MTLENRTNDRFDGSTEPTATQEFECNQEGVFFVGSGRLRICGPLRVIARVRDMNGNNWSRTLEWHDADGMRHEATVTEASMTGNGEALVRTLVDGGLWVCMRRNASELLVRYLRSCDAPRRRSVAHLGWEGGVFVTPSITYGGSGEPVVFQSSAAVQPTWAQSGTLDEWKTHVARLAVGNSRLVLAIASAFAAPMLRVLDVESGGFHLFGTSSSGKTTALRVAASVYGAPKKYVRSWNSTANALEGMAALHRDCLLPLDEMSQASAAHVGQAVYMFGNEVGKGRMLATTDLRESVKLRLIFFSDGEIGVEAHMARDQLKTNTGQVVRAAEIDADAGAGLGAFEELHECASGKELSDALLGNANLYHGTAIHSFLSILVEQQAELRASGIEEVRRLAARLTGSDAPAQVARVATRFALVACAGEYATDWGVTGWEPGESARAAATCFAVWRERYGHDGAKEDAEIVALFRTHFQLHGASHFESRTKEDGRVVLKRYGFVDTDENGELQFYVSPAAFKQMCGHFDPRRASRVLIDRGLLLADSLGKSTRPVRLPKLSGATTRCYVFRGSMVLCES